MAAKSEDLRKKLEEIVDDPKATTGNRLKAIELLTKIGDPKPQSVDQQIVEQIIREERGTKTSVSNLHRLESTCLPGMTANRPESKG